MTSRTLHKLAARKVETLRTPGRYGDGGGLALVVSKSGSATWVFRYRVRGSGKPTELGLGSRTDVSLADARAQAATYRSMLAKGQDPGSEKRAERARQSSVPTFSEALELFIAQRGAGWRNAKHRQQWRNAVTQHAGAKFMVTPVDRIGVDEVVTALLPIWTKKAETASRIRGRIENVLDFSRVSGWRTGSNPATWRGNLQHLLPPRRKLQRGHHPALPYGEVPQFVARLRRSDSVSAAAFEFLVLTAARTGEAIGATWTEISADLAVWTVPPERMKNGLQHSVPLPPRATEILRTMRRMRRSDADFVFPGQKSDRPLSNMSLESILRRWDLKPATAHGFRSSFRDWAAEQTDFPREVAEACLSHVVAENKTEAAYLRTTHFAKRSALLRQWATYLAASRLAPRQKRARTLETA